MNWIKCTDRLPRKQHKVLAGIYGSDLLRPEEGESLRDCAERLKRTVKRIEVCFLDEEGKWTNEDGRPMVVYPTVWCPFPYLPSWDELHCEKGDDFDCNTCEKQEECFHDER